MPPTHVEERNVACAMCTGTGTTHNLYVTHSVFAAGCPRCGGTGVEPTTPVVHMGMVVAHPRRGTRWCVYGVYPGTLATPPTDHARAWGIHRMKPARRGGHYVWQIRVFGEDRLLTWPVVGYGTAWDHALMESTPL